jgi:hypothetical protein
VWDRDSLTGQPGFFKKGAKRVRGLIDARRPSNTVEPENKTTDATELFAEIAIRRIGIPLF